MNVTSFILNKNENSNTNLILKIMKTTATYQGTTKEELQLRIIYCENVLKNNELEVWEAREYNDVIKEYKKQIEEIEENQKILNQMK